MANVPTERAHLDELVAAEAVERVHTTDEGDLGWQHGALERKLVDGVQKDLETRSDVEVAQEHQLLDRCSGHVDTRHQWHVREDGCSCRQMPSTRDGIGIQRRVCHDNVLGHLKAAAHHEVAAQNAHVGHQEVCKTGAGLLDSRGGVLAVAGHNMGVQAGDALALALQGVVGQTAPIEEVHDAKAVVAAEPLVHLVRGRHVVRAANIHVHLRKAVNTAPLPM